MAGEIVSWRRPATLNIGGTFVIRFCPTPMLVKVHRCIRAPSLQYVPMPSNRVAVAGLERGGLSGYVWNWIAAQYLPITAVLF